MSVGGVSSPDAHRQHQRSTKKKAAPGAALLVSEGLRKRRIGRQ